MIECDSAIKYALTVLIDRELTILEASSSFFKLLGYTPEDHLNLNLQSFIHEDSREWLKKIMDQPQTIHTGKVFELSFIRHRGQKLTFEAVCHTVAQNGNVCVLLECWNITERKREMDAVLESYHRYRHLFQKGNDPAFVFYTNDDGEFSQIFDFNEQAQEIFELEGKALLLKHPLDLVAEDNRQSLQDGIIHAMGNGFFHCEQLIRTDSGKTVPVEASFHFFEMNNQKTVMAFLRDITEKKEAQMRLQKSMEQLKRIQDETVNALSLTAEKRDLYTSGHQRRVSLLAVAIAHELGWDQTRCEILRISALLHDIGKISIPAEILSKPSTLTRIEYDLIKTHSTAGFEILETIEFPGPVADTVLQHHERVDGSGYPNKLEADQILEEAKVLGVSDVVEAMTFHRPYRPAYGVDIALREIQLNAGRLYDRNVSDACIKVFLEKNFSFEH